MSLQVQAQTIGEIIDCLCALFAAEDVGDQQEAIDELVGQMMELFYSLKSDLEDINHPVSIEPNFEDPCQLAKDIAMMYNTLLVNSNGSGESGGGGDGEGEGNPTTSFYNVLLNNYLSIIDALNQEGINPCDGGGDGEEETKYNIKDDCICLIFSLDGQIEGVNEDIETLINLFNTLQASVDDVADLLVDGEITWPEDLCGKLKMTKDLLGMMQSNPNAIPPEKKVTIDQNYAEFNNQIDIVKTSLAELGMYPCINDVEFIADSIYIQAAGSDGGDGSSAGVHLRWSFMGELADQHLPKGHLAEIDGPYPTSIGFNKKDDFVKIYRAEYNDPVPIIIDLNALDINQNNFVELQYGTFNEWQFELSDNGFINKIFLRFILDGSSTYVSPNSNGPAYSVNNFSGVMEIGVINRKMFAGEFRFATSFGPSNNQYEAIGSYMHEVEPTFSILSRIENSNSNQRIENECIEYFRFKITSVLNIIELETYTDFYLSHLPYWNFLGQFALTENDTEVFNRLEDPSRFTIDQQWPAFNNGTKVLKSTYIDKWNELNGIKHGVQEYLERSRTDVYASTELGSEDPNSTAVFPFKYLEMLNLISLDYHIARMFGLAYIDVEPAANNLRYVYFADYSVGEKPNLFFTLPTSKNDQRLPPKPEPEPISYGLSPTEGSDSFLQLDALGYSQFTQARYVRIDRKDYPFEIPWQTFFETDNFDLGVITKPIRFGIEYKLSTDTAYVKPEITADPTSPYKSYDAGEPNSEVAETIPVLDNEKALYVHKVTTNGIHEYAIYGINWFSRPSLVSDKIFTDATTIKSSESLLPPSNPQVIFIQSDALPILLSESEILNYTDKLRIKFDWNHIQNISYQQATKVEIYFRVDEPLSVKGEIDIVEKISGSEEVKIYARGYNLVSSLNNDPVSPEITSTNKSKFIGSRLVAGKQSYLITDIPVTGLSPVIQIKPEVEMSKIQNTNNPKEYFLKKKFIVPEVDLRFSIHENVSDVANWTKLARTINIEHISNYSEVVTEEDGNTTTLTIGGLTDSVAITADPNIDGLYKIVLQNEDLPIISQSLVFWNEGIVRFIDSSGVKELRVWRMDDSSGLLEIWAYDANESGAGLPTSGTVNLHPSYLVYLDQETGIFDETVLLPTGTNNTKITYLALRAIDDSVSPAVTSDLTSMLEIKANKIYETIPPALPVGPTFATRPDTFGKSTYTFDNNVISEGGREPYGMMFLRTNDQKILDALYIATTVTQIRAELAGLSNGFHVNRFNDLANVVLDPDGQFIDHNNEGFSFPEPDNPDIPVYTTTAEKIDILRKVINTAFVPLTKEPVVFSKIKEGYLTENIEPVTRNQQGKLLDNNHSEYNPYPMVRKYQDEEANWNVRFTDYSLDGASTNEYFYFSREINHQYEFGERGPISGPIQLVNSMPPSAPEIVSVTTVLADPTSSQPTAIEFLLNEYPEIAKIIGIKLYRTLVPEHSMNTRLMYEIGEFDPNSAFQDVFDNLIYPPFGETIYYRLVATKTIINEQSEPEEILSHPSSVIEAAIIDNMNPSAPEFTIKYAIDPNGNYINTSIKWDKSVHNGTYYIYKMTDSGNWQKIHEMSSNDETIDLPLASTALGSGLLLNTDSYGNKIYHRFKIDVENSSGLMNLNEEIITFPYLGISYNGIDGMAIGSTFSIK